MLSYHSKTTMGFINAEGTRQERHFPQWKKLTGKGILHISESNSIQNFIYIEAKILLLLWNMSLEWSKRTRKD
jgi:hypothetical protein